MSSNITTHVAADLAVEGGWYQLPTIPENHIPDAAFALVYIQNRGWVVSDGQGHVFAEAENPAHLATYMEELLDAMGHMHARGEL